MNGGFPDMRIRLRGSTGGFGARSVIVLALLVASGCASFHSYRQAQIAEQRGDWDQAVLQYLEALADDPGNVSYRAGLLRAKIKASQAHFEKGKAFHQAGLHERAMIELQQATQLDPTNQYAEVELRKVRDRLDAASRQRAAPVTLDEMKAKTRGRSAQPPVLNPRSPAPISIDFPRPQSLMQIYKAVGKAFGVNILFDPQLRDQELAIELKEVTAQQAFETLIRAAGHFYKVIDDHTILIAVDNAQNRRTYEDQVIQNFFLSNVEVKDALTMLRSLVDAKKVASNEQLNAIMMRDSADKVKVAERLIQAIDKSRSEVVVDVELLQINTNKLRELGASLSSYQVAQTLDLGGEDIKLHVSDLEFLNQGNWALTIPNFLYDFVKQNGNAQLLAKPQLRISEGENAKLHIGDRVPIPVTTFNQSQTVGSNIVPITSFQYQDVGIKIDIEPRVHHNREVTLKLKVEVSNISSFVEGTGGQRQPIIGTRTIESNIRLRDGETNFLAGLIRTDESDSEVGIPGLSEIPILGRLFSKRSNQNQRTDLILTMTPHIIRTPDVSEEDLMPIWVGTEANISFRNSPRVESPEPEGPFEEMTPEETRDLIRRRIQELPRGIDATEGEAPPSEVPPASMNLAPAGGPTDIFNPPPPPPPDEEEPPGGSAYLSNAPYSDAAAGADAAGFADAAAAFEDDGVAISELELAAGDELSAAEFDIANAAAGASARAAVRLRFQPSRVSVESGEPFEVDVVASARLPVSHLPVALVYDPAALRVERVEPGDFLGSASEAQVLWDLSRAGEILIGASRLGDQPGRTGTGRLVRITLRALRPGRARISFLVNEALDAEREPVEPVAAGSLVVISAPASPRAGAAERGVNGS